MQFRPTQRRSQILIVSAIAIPTVIAVIALASNITLQPPINTSEQSKEVDKPKKRSQGGTGKIAFSDFYTNRSYLTTSSDWTNQFSIPPIQRNPSPPASYVPSELTEAISFLHIPNWTRNYVPCTSPESPVSCDDIIRAYRAIKRYDEKILATPPNELRFIKRSHMSYGAINTLFSDIIATGLAIYTGRAVSLELESQTIQSLSSTPVDQLPQTELGDRDFYYPRPILYGTKKFYELRNQGCSRFPDDFQYRSSHIDDIKEDKSTVCYSLDHLYFPVFLYQWPGVSDFIQENFGEHFIYFMTNYISRIPQRYINKAVELYSKVPKGTIIVASHLRFDYPGNILYNSPDRISKAHRFFDEEYSRTGGNIRLVIMSDNGDVQRKAASWKSGRYIIAQESERLPGGSQKPASMMDLALLMNADVCLLTARSTFSLSVAHRTGQPKWYLDPESPNPIRQMTYFGLYFDTTFHSDTTGLGQASMHLRHQRDNERLHRYMYDRFGL